MKKNNLLTIDECISLLEIYKEKYILNDYKQTKDERESVMRKIRYGVLSLKGGKKAYDTIRDYVVDHGQYDESIEVLEKAKKYSRFWPLSIIVKAELQVFDYGFTIIFVLLGIVKIFLGTLDVNNATGSDSWPSVKGIITKSYVSLHYDIESSTTSYSPMIEYTYTVDGKDYSNNRRTYKADSEDHEWVDTTLSDYPKGIIVQVHYKPEDHSVSVLEPGLFASTYDGIHTGLFFIAIGVFYYTGRSIYSIHWG